MIQTDTQSADPTGTGIDIEIYVYPVLSHI